MRTTLNLADDALIIARHVADREHISLSQAISQLVRTGADLLATGRTLPLRGRFALLPQRDEIVTAEHVRKLILSAA